MIRQIAIAAALMFLAGAALAQSPQPALDMNQQAVVKTSAGTFVISFFPDKAPRHVRLFLDLAASGAYDGTLFHRTMKWGIVQAGDPLSRDPAKKPLWGSGGMNKVPSEISDIKHERGSVSSVLLPGQPNSGGNQFFISVTPQPALDGKYSVFGLVTDGIEVVDRISETPLDNEQMPVNPPVIQKVTLRPAQPPPQPAFSTLGPQQLSEYRATLETTLGSITLEFFPDLAPNHVRSFLRLSEAGFYDGTAFHRVVKDFVIQGGLLHTRQPPLPDFRQKDLVRRLQPEFNATKHIKGILSMARADEKDSAETSFFICLGDADGLDNEYTAFGKVVDGMEVLEKFQKVEVDGETPKERIELKRVVLSKKTP
jgi:cyclophilin family peptidyl-prolyl cis-trans isomerase